MKLVEAKQRLNQLSNISFNELFNETDLNTIMINKGKTGQLLELALGLSLSNTNLDFEDGELKTNKCDADGHPCETIFITQISGIIDELIQRRTFTQTLLYKKIRNILYVPVCKKDEDPRNWMFLPSIHVDLNNPQFSQLYNIWENDYYSICEQLQNHIETSCNGFIHTSNGHHIQIRSKDSKPYHPIYSNIYNRIVSNKNHAFYFRKQFVYDIQSMTR